MPVLRYVITEPVEVLLEGEQMRSIAMNSPVSGLPLAGIQTFWPTDGAEASYPVIVCDCPRANAGISTSAGAWVPLVRGPALPWFVGGTERWVIAGTTRDSAGVALGSCRVVVLETGRIAVSGNPVVSEAVSDGSGAFSLEVSGNTAHHLIAYKPGSPDVAGASLVTITPTQV